MCQGFPGALAVNNLPVMQETWVPSLGWEGLLEKGMQPTPVFLPGKSHGQRSLVGYGSWSHKELNMREATDHTHDAIRIF